MRADVFAAIRRLGTELSPSLLEGTMALFAPLVARPDPQVCTVIRDLAYGPDPRHRLDVFAPAHPGSGSRPVVAFVHGGGFVRGDKGAADAPFYNNVGVWAVQNGLIGVTMTYRLAPGARWPAGAADIAAALDWLSDNIAGHGGDPRRIFLLGQSAGAVHVAGHVAGHHGRAASGGVAGAIMLSGIYDLLTLNHSQYEAAYFGTDRTLFPVRSSLDKLASTNLPCLYTVSEFDPASFQKQAVGLVNAHWAVRGALPRLLYLPGHNHLSPVSQLGSAIDTLGAHLIGFMQTA